MLVSSAPPGPTTPVQPPVKTSASTAAADTLRSPLCYGMVPPIARGAPPPSRTRSTGVPNNVSLDLSDAAHQLVSLGNSKLVAVPKQESSMGPAAMNEPSKPSQTLNASNFTPSSIQSTRTFFPNVSNWPFPALPVYQPMQPAEQLTKLLQLSELIHGVSSYTSDAVQLPSQIPCMSFRPPLGQRQQVSWQTTEQRQEQLKLQQQYQQLQYYQYEQYQQLQLHIFAEQLIAQKRQQDQLEQQAQQVQQAQQLGQLQQLQQLYGLVQAEQTAGVPNPSPQQPKIRQLETNSKHRRTHQGLLSPDASPVQRPFSAAVKGTLEISTPISPRSGTTKMYSPAVSPLLSGTPPPPNPPKSKRLVQISPKVDTRANEEAPYGYTVAGKPRRRPGRRPGRRLQQSQKMQDHGTNARRGAKGVYKTLPNVDVRFKAVDVPAQKTAKTRGQLKMASVAAAGPSGEPSTKLTKSTRAAIIRPVKEVLAEHPASALCSHSDAAKDVPSEERCLPETTSEVKTKLLPALFDSKDGNCSYQMQRMNFRWPQRRPYGMPPIIGVPLQDFLRTSPSPLPCYDVNSSKAADTDRAVDASTTSKRVAGEVVKFGREQPLPVVAGSLNTTTTTSAGYFLEQSPNRETMSPGAKDQEYGLDGHACRSRWVMYSGFKDGMKYVRPI